MSTVPSTVSKATPEAPWLGLAHFTAAEREYFHGREKEVRELADRARRASLTILYGVSGYGKSSLLGAGLIPTLEEDDHAVILLRRCYDDLHRRPLEGDVMKAVAAGYPGAVLPEQETLWEFFHDRRQPWFSEAGGDEENDPPRVMLVFDQFEEIFTRGEDRTTTDKQGDENARRHAKQFLTQLADVVENRTPEGLRERLRTGTEEERRALLQAYDFQSQPVGVVLSLRDDFLARLERWRRVMPRIMEHRVELRMLAGLEAYEAVYLPGAKRAGQPPIIPPEVAASIVRAAAGVTEDVPLEDIEAVPPILSLLCERLNSRRLAAPQPASRIVATDFDSTEASRILGTFYGEKLKPHPRALRDFIEDELVSDNGFRESRLLASSLADLRSKVPDAEQRLRQLVDDRILVIEVRAGMERVEFTHDTLARLALENRQSRESRRKKVRLAGWSVAAAVITGISIGVAFWTLGQAKRAEENAKDAVAATVARDRLLADTKDFHRYIQDNVLPLLDPKRDEQQIKFINDQVRLIAESSNEPLGGLQEANDIVIKANQAAASGATEDALKLFGEACGIFRKRIAAKPGDTESILSFTYASNRLGEIHQLAGELDQAQAGFEASVEVLEGVTASGNPVVTHYLGLSLGKVGEVEATRNLPGAVVNLDRSVKMLTGTDNTQPYHKESLLFAAQFASVKGDLMWRLADKEQADEGKHRLFDAGTAAFSSSRDIYLSLLSMSPGEPNYLGGAGFAMERLGMMVLGKMALRPERSTESALGEAEGYFRSSVQYRREMVSRQPSPLAISYLCYSLERLGEVLQKQGRHQLALEEFQKSLSYREQLLAAQPDDSQSRRLLAQLYRWMGISNAGISQAERLRFYALSADTWRPLLEKEPVSTDDRKNYLANIYESSEVLRVSGDVAKAEELRRECHQQLLLIPQGELGEFWSGVAASLKDKPGQ